MSELLRPPCEDIDTSRLVVGMKEILERASKGGDRWASFYLKLLAERQSEFPELSEIHFLPTVSYALLFNRLARELDVTFASQLPVGTGNMEAIGRHLYSIYKAEWNDDPQNSPGRLTYKDSVQNVYKVLLSGGVNLIPSVRQLMFGGKPYHCLAFVLVGYGPQLDAVYSSWEKGQLVPGKNGICEAYKPTGLYTVSDWFSALDMAWLIEQSGDLIALEFRQLSETINRFYEEESAKYPWLRPI